MDFYKFPPTPWPQVVPFAPDSGRDLVSQLVRYQSTDRLTAADVSRNLIPLFLSHCSPGFEPRFLQVAIDKVPEEFRFEGL